MARAMVRLTSKTKFSSSADTVNSIAFLDMAESFASYFKQLLRLADVS